MTEAIRFGIITVSDTCFNGTKVDTSGPRLKKEVSEIFPSCKVVETALVEDELEKIKNYLETWADNGICDVILTTGGTGFAERDVTPEATRQVIQKEAPGLAYTMISRSLQTTEMAMLSRAVCGIRKRTLIVNLPGSEKGAVECLGFIKRGIPHAVDLLKSFDENIKAVHSYMQNKRPEDRDKKIEKDSISPSKVKMDSVATRSRTSPYPMLEVDEANEVILKECSPTLETEAVHFEKALHRVLAEDVFAEEPVPAFRASIKDGYAVRSSDGCGNRYVKEVAAAGDEPFKDELKEGEAIRISTGAAVPAGADAVVQVEDTTVVETSADNKSEVIISINSLPKAGQDIREIGSDVPANSLVLKKGDRITPAHVGVMAMLGKLEVKVFKQPSIGVLSTGNEVKAPGDHLKPGQIRDSNKPTLVSLLKKYHYEPVDCGTVMDDPTSVKAVLHEAFSKNDVVISSGGVSMGEFDVLKRVLVEDFGAEIHFGRVNMKPGKPTTFATFVYGEKLKKFFGLPGNPVSCGVTCLLFVIPTLRYLERSTVYRFPVINVRGSLINQDSRPEYQRVQVKVNSGYFVMKSTGNQISSRLNSLVDANGLALVISRQKLTNFNVLLFDEISC
nr:gephyrin [Leptinotarsa decemlineata]